MVGLPPELYREVRRILMECAAFDSDRELRALFVDLRLSPWRNRVPEASSRQSRVQAVMALLVNAANTSGDNALVLLVQVLRDLTDSEDTLYADLCRLAVELTTALESSPQERDAAPFVTPPPSSITIIGDGSVLGSGSSSYVVKTTAAGDRDRELPTPSVDLPVLRQGLARYDAVEIESLCLDHFPAVYDKLSRGLQRGEMINLLLDYCRRIPEAAARLAVLLAGENAVVPQEIPSRAPHDVPAAPPLPVYRALTLRIFAREDSALPDAPYPVELIVPGGRDFRRGQLQLDAARLAALATDPHAYGRELGEMLFAEGALGGVYRETLAVAQSHGEKLRVRLQLEAPELDDVRWERIYHPIQGTWFPLAATADVLLSRYVLTEAWNAPQAVTAHPVRVLVVLASPRNLDQYGLVPIQENERAQWHAVFDRLPGAEVAYLESGTADAPTLASVRRALIQGYQVVQFLCHGVRTRQGVSLMLEQENQDADRVDAGRLLEMLRGLPVRPALCSLAACESGIFDPGGNFAALGPALVGQGGIPAVVAMSGPVRLTTALAFAGQFHDRLFAHGVVDLAVHEARAEVRDQLDWSVPVLFSRLPENRLWAANLR
jgi:hypothetical protein